MALGEIILHQTLEEHSCPVDHQKTAYYQRQPLERLEVWAVTSLFPSELERDSASGLKGRHLLPTQLNVTMSLMGSEIGANVKFSVWALFCL